MLKKVGAAIVGLAAAAGVAIGAEERIKFPANYATEFTNYLSLDRVQNEDQIIRLFANAVAAEAAAKGEPLPNGAILVGEVYKAKKDKDGNVITSTLGRRVRDELAAIAVMEKQDGWGEIFTEDLKNGDWDFAIFKPTGERLGKDLNECRRCHAPLKDQDHVFSIEHLRK